MHLPGPIQGAHEGISRFQTGFFSAGRTHFSVGAQAPRNSKARSAMPTTLEKETENRKQETGNKHSTAAQWRNCTLSASSCCCSFSVRLDMKRGEKEPSVDFFLKKTKSYIRPPLVAETLYGRGTRPSQGKEGPDGGAAPLWYAAAACGHRVTGASVPWWRF